MPRECREHTRAGGIQMLNFPSFYRILERGDLNDGDMGTAAKYHSEKLNFLVICLN